MVESVAYGVFGPLGLDEPLMLARHSLKATAEYLRDPTLMAWAGLNRDISIVSPHGSPVRFELELERRSPIYALPYGEHGPLWHAMRKVRVNRLAGKLGVSRNLFFPPISHNSVSHNPPTAVQDTILMELLADVESTNRYHPASHPEAGQVMIVTCIGESVLDQVCAGFGQTGQPVFDPSKLRQQLSTYKEAAPAIIPMVTQTAALLE